MSYEGRELDRAIARAGVAEIDDVKLTEVHAAFAAQRPTDVNAFVRGYFGSSLPSPTKPQPVTPRQPAPAPSTNASAGILAMSDADRAHHLARVGNRQYVTELMTQLKGTKVTLT